MYFSIALLTIVFFVFVLSQFGSRLLARQALLWWIVFSFVVMVIIKPDLFKPLATFFGVQLLSNFAFAGLILLLMLLLIEQSAELTRSNRRIREIVTSDACRQFIHKRLNTSSYKKPLAVIVLPCFNEEAEIPDLSLRLSKVLQSSDIAFDFCFINDGSQDQTESALHQNADQHFCSHQVNLGVSSALLTGFKISRDLNCDYVVQCDSDGQHPVELIPELIDNAQRNNIDLLIGSRFIKDTKQAPLIHDRLESTNTIRRIGIILISLILKLFHFRTQVTDPTSGLRVYSKKAVATLLRTMPDEYPEPESIAILSLNGLIIEETRVRMQPRITGTSSLTGLKGALYMIRVLSSLLGLRLRLLPKTKRFGL